MQQRQENRNGPETAPQTRHQTGVTMPASLADAIYLGLAALITLGVAIIGYLVNNGFSGLKDQLRGLEKGIAGLRTDLGREREDRITLFGQLKSEIDSHKAVCDERWRTAQYCTEFGRRTNDLTLHR